MVCFVFFVVFGGFFLAGGRLSSFFFLQHYAVSMYQKICLVNSDYLFFLATEAGIKDLFIYLRNCSTISQYCISDVFQDVLNLRGGSEIKSII